MISANTGGYIDKAQSENNYSFENALNLDGLFVLGNNPDVGNSSTMPYVSIHATANNAMDYYSFTVLEAGTTAVFDIDYAQFENSGFDSVLQLLNSQFEQISYNDDERLHDSGSVHDFDSYLTHTFATSGTYYIMVKRFWELSIPEGLTYQLQVSLSKAIMKDLSFKLNEHDDSDTSDYHSTGVLTFNDPDLLDTHSVSAELVSVSDSLGRYTLAFGEFVATIDSLGEITWTFDADAIALKPLDAGQVITQTYLITLDDGHGGIVSKEVSIVLTGTQTDTAQISVQDHVYIAQAGYEVLDALNVQDNVVDIFKWTLDSLGQGTQPEIDLVRNFDVQANVDGVNGGDVLDLSELLQNETQEASNLINYLHFEISNNNTTIYISHEGSFGGDDRAIGGAFSQNTTSQLIMLEDVDLLQQYQAAIGDQDLIQALLDANKLYVG